MTNESQNEEFYLECDPIVFRVEDELFKVPRQLFLHESSVFRDMVDMPICESKALDGNSDKNPLVLEGVQKNNFITLLKFLFKLSHE
ncbi:hypothetical protein AX17_006123 [Amanita inopinata Kibby_2008]|nr:hypothetical protein AX17_006123 [Amanita inopinata Kibby_2008]